MADDFVRYCLNCHLVYRPDERIYVEPDTYCPKCGHKLDKDNPEEFEEAMGDSV